MPRQARIDAPGALHHVIARGIERCKIFRTKKDYADFVTRLAVIFSETGTACYAWALIPSHFHLLLKTGAVPIATVMRRLLTGYAVSFNHRHRRHGHVFQNRYKSILCQEDAYLLELVRYIHLNPLRAGIVPGCEALGWFPYAGHGAIAGSMPNDWQDVDSVLTMFADQPATARLRYRRFVEDGAQQGQRPELTGGGMIRSLGGWAAVKERGKSLEFRKSDERILGDGDFVEKTLKEAGEAWKRQEVWRAKGITLDHLLPAVSEIMGLPTEEVLLPGKNRQRVRARSLLCYWAVRDLGMTMTAMARESGLSVPSVAKSVERGEGIVRELNCQLLKVLKR